MRRLIALSLLLLAPLAATGCGSDSITDQTPSVVGTWQLSTVDGAPLPLTVVDGDPRIEVLSDELTLTANGAFTQRTVLRFTQAGATSTDQASETGTWTLSGSTLTFRFASDGSMVGAALGEARFTVSSEGHSFVYVRR